MTDDRADLVERARIYSEIRKKPYSSQRYYYRPEIIDELVNCIEVLEAENRRLRDFIWEEARQECVSLGMGDTQARIRANATLDRISAEMRAALDGETT